MRIFNSIIKNKYNLSTSESLKKTKHITLEIKEDIEYKVGDHIAIYPTNCINHTFQILNFFKEIPKEFKGFNPEEFLMKNIDLENINKNLIKLIVSKKSNDLKKNIEEILKPEKKDLLQEFIMNQNLLNFLTENKDAIFTFEEFINNSLPLTPRFYSISSSPKKNKKQIDLTVEIIEYKTPFGIKSGVCSKFFSNISINSEVKCHIQSNPSFHLPSNEKDIIMIGTGTGIAPFRAFLQERFINKSKGKNWLFFGEATKRNNFYYEEELNFLIKKDFLKLDTAFSRDEEKKIYVQHKILEKKEELWNWIKNGAFIYICGGRDMGKDIDKTINEIIKEKNNLNENQAIEYIKNLKNEKRYLKDVY